MQGGHGVADQLWVRRSYYDGTSWRCTVKFDGQIPPWPSAIALGVEWDNPSRGKNSGDIDGVRYFDCRVPGAGSFIKRSRPYERELSIGEAIHAKYINNAEFTEVELNGGKAIETVGVEKLHKKHEHIETLSVISLEASLVKHVSGGPIRLDSLRALESLDLSNNLLESFDDVLDLISNLPRLSSLRLNGNRLKFNTTKVFPQIRELHLSDLLVSEKDISIISACFPETRTLSLAQNRLTSVPKELPPKLSTLDLSCNLISELSDLPASLNSLFISANSITEIKDSTGLPESLDVRGHPLHWDSISMLGSSSVLDLHITHHEGAEVAHRPFVIARCPRITKLNGTVITSQEREDAEMYTINAVVTRKHSRLAVPVWQHLIRKYGEPAQLPDRSIRARLFTFYVGSDPNPHRVVRDAPAPRLYRQIARAVNVPLRKVSLARLRGARLVTGAEAGHVLTVEEIIDDGAHIEIDIDISDGNNVHK